jgi:phospholipase C
MTPRRILAGVACVLLVALATAPAGASNRRDAKGSAARTPIQHIVTLMQENHSFDNYFGSYPGAEGIPKGACVPVNPAAAQPCVKPFVIGRQPLESLDHDRAHFDVARNGGAMNGFVAAQSSRAATNNLTMGHYQPSDLRYYWNLANEYVLFDHFFSASAGSSRANHLFWTTGTSGALAADAIPAGGLGNLPTIFDRLEAAGVSWKFYVQNYDPRATFRRGPQAERSAQVARVPLLAYARYIDDPKLFSHIVPVSQYFEDLQRGTLPAVSYIVPSGSSERPPSNLRSGQRFVRSLLDGLSASQQWASSAFIWTYDTWGGWYDHVSPPQVDQDGYGFRVPALLVSPYARRGHVDHTQLDSTSILRFIEDNWSLPPLAARDANAKSLRPAFDFAAVARPATLVPADRALPTAVRSRTSVVLVLYLTALAFAVALIGAVVWRMRRPEKMPHRWAQWSSCRSYPRPSLARSDPGTPVPRPSASDRRHHPSCSGRALRGRRPRVRRRFGRDRHHPRDDGSATRSAYRA